MSRSTANVSFYCRESKKNKDGLAPILVLFRSIGGVEHAERMERFE